jgi:probable phosphoglycerate mutase
MATVLLARHGETGWNRRGLIQGWAPVRLTDRGDEQAAALAAAVADRAPDRLVCSDLERATATAETVAASTELAPVPARTWRERDAGFLQGLPADEAFERFPRLAGGGETLDESPASGESVREFVDRVERAWTTLRDDLAPDETVVVVTHGGVLSTVVALVDDRSVPEVFRGDGPQNCALTEVTVRDTGTTLVREGTTAHLDARLTGD